MVAIFQLALFGLVALSFLLVIGVPVVFASPDGWSSSKNFIFSSVSLWIFLVFLVGILDAFAQGSL
jgi:photosystem II PsbZ protein